MQPTKNKSSKDKGGYGQWTRLIGSISNSLYKTCLQAIMVVVINETCLRLGNAKFIYNDSL